MSNHMATIVVAAVALTAITAGNLLWHRHYHTPIQVPLVEIGRLPSDIELSGLWWRVLSSKESEAALAEKTGLHFPENDYDLNYLCFSAGRPLEQLTYTRASKRYCHASDTYMGVAILGSEYTPFIYYLYSVPPIRIWCSEQADMGQHDIIRE